MATWDNVPLGEVVNLQRGFDLPTQDRKPGSVPIVSSSGITGRHSEPRVTGPGVVTGRYGTIGEVFYVEDDFWPLNTTLWVQDFKGNDPRFVSYLLRTLNYQSHNDKSSVPGVNRNHLHQERVLRPPIDEQRAIAHILGTLDDKIELNRRMNATLEAIARALFQSWFVDFDPVRAKVAGRQPAGMDAGTAALFPDSLIQAEYVIPDGWAVNTLGDEFDITMGQSPPGSTYNQDGVGVPFFQGRTDFGFRFPNRRVFCTEPTRRAVRGDTLVSVRAPVGDLNIAIEDCAIGRGVAAVQHPSGSNSYTYEVLRHLQPTLRQFESEGTVFGAINKQGLHGLKIVTPPTSIVRRFDGLVSPIDQLIEHNEVESNALVELRDTILPMLLSGEVAVSEHAPMEAVLA